MKPKKYRTYRLTAKEKRRNKEWMQEMKECSFGSLRFWGLMDELGNLLEKLEARDARRAG